MNTKQVLEAMSNGAVLCKGYTGLGSQYWLEPKRQIVAEHVANSILSLPNLKKGTDDLFQHDDNCQTWRL